MSYQPGWQHQDAAGHVRAGEPAHAADVSELESAINRRLKAMFDPGRPALCWPRSFAVSAGSAVGDAPLLAARDGTMAMLPPAVTSYLTHAAGWGQLTLWAWWLDPRAGATENDAIVRDSRPPGAGEVGLFAAINGGSAWTAAGEGRMSAVHVNELRDAMALLSRGRYRLRVGDGGSAKASKSLPGGLWMPPAVARDGSHAMHSWFGGRQWLWPGDGAGGYLGPRGQSLLVRGATIRLKSEGGDLKISLHHCLRNVNSANFSWTHYDAAAGLAWTTPGGTGGGDSEHIVDLDLLNNSWTSYSDASLTTLAGAMFAGLAEPTFMLAPNQDTGWDDDPVHVQVELEIDFELTSPPV